MYTRQITSEETYTLSEARRIINRETRERRKSLIESIQKKAIGVFCIVVGIVGAAITKDATPLLLLLCAIFFFEN
mgnify:FL=1